MSLPRLTPRGYVSASTAAIVIVAAFLIVSTLAAIALSVVTEQIEDFFP